MAPRRKNTPQCLFRPPVDIRAFLERRLSQDPRKTSVPLYIAIVSGTHTEDCDFSSIAFPFAESDGEDLDLEEIGCAENSDSVNLDHIQHRLSKIANTDRDFQARISTILSSSKAAPAGSQKTS